MRVCELRKCEVINVRDCRRIGFAMDVEFEPSTGCIKAIIVPGPCSVFDIVPFAAAFKACFTPNFIASCVNLPIEAIADIPPVAANTEASPPRYPSPDITLPFVL